MALAPFPRDIRGGSVLEKKGMRFVSVVFCFFGFEAAIANPQRVSPEELQQILKKKVLSVTEFRVLREEAESLGVRVWLFGGTAAGLGHYVADDLKREKGDTTYHPSRFDYDFTNIYRSTQDVDIVIDGTPSDAERLTARMLARYPHMQGSKNGWEVRLLRQGVQDKEALLDNPNFLRQHSDSNSTGLIEITDPPSGEPNVRDLRDWTSPNPRFLTDIAEKKITYYFSPEHGSTSRAQQGLNPEIFSVIRFLTKAFQFGLEIDPADLRRMEKIVTEFDPRSSLKSDYVQHWIIKNAKKLVQNSRDVERSWNELERLGLRKKLMQLDGLTEKDSLAWWMNKEPLRTRPLGEGSGRTARELGISTVAHETNGYHALESITLSPTGEPNILISRSDVPYESAIYGDGFYTKIGREGAAGTGLTIRFQLKPEAREGTDFIRTEHNFIIIKNKRAIEFIPETYSMGPLEFFQWMVSSSIPISEKGVIERLRRRVAIKMNDTDVVAKSKMREIVLEQLRAPKTASGQLIVDAWLGLTESAHHKDILDLIPLWHNGNESDILRIYSSPNWFGKLPINPVADLLETGKYDEILLRDVISRPEFANHPEGFNILMRHFVHRNSDLPDGNPNRTGELISKINKRKRLVEKYISTQPHWQNHPEVLRQTKGKAPTFNRLKYNSPIIPCLQSATQLAYYGAIGTAVWVVLWYGFIKPKLQESGSK